MADARGWAHQVVWLFLCFLGLSSIGRANHDAKRLFDDLLRKSGYNRLIRPARESNDTLTVKMGVRLSQLIDVDEKNEIVTTKMWVIQQWVDVRLMWDPEEYGWVDTLYVPSTSIWLPDIVLYNNADGDFNITLMTKATLQSNGTVSWEPPAIYKSYCNINVEYFPFDEQNCSLKFSPWTYDGFQVDLQHIWTQQLGLADDTTPIAEAMELTKYHRSVEWDLMSVPAKKTVKWYPCCKEPFPDITFSFVIRRKTLAYNINLIIPCVSINMLTILTFYLPSDSGEKISLSTTILLSLSMFQLLLMESVPATSTAIPLLGKYIFFTIIMVALSVFVSVVTLNINFHSMATHEMSSRTHWIFLEILPRILLMKRPKDEKNEEEPADFDICESDLERLQNPYRKKLKHLDVESDVDSLYGQPHTHNVSSQFIGMGNFMNNIDLSNFCEACAQRKARTYPPNMQKAIGGVCFVAKHMKSDDESNKVKDEWKYVALVIDRIFLFIYLSVCVLGAMGIMMNSPALFDGSQPLDQRETVKLTENISTSCGSP